MKRVVSISLGSSLRDHCVDAEFVGQRLQIERIGTDGDIHRAISLIRELDGKVAAFGMGGTDLYIYAGGRRYTFAESAKIAAAAQQTPIVDGSGIKNTLERTIPTVLAEYQGRPLAGSRVLLVSALDRFGLAEAFAAAGCQLTCGDLMFGLGLPLPVRGLAGLSRLVSVAAPVVTRLPVRWLYPTGAKQLERTPKFSSAFSNADIIAGDFHFIKRFMPEKLPDKIVVTNTVTATERQWLAQCGVRLLVTSAPVMAGRSFGSNVLEGILVAVAEQKNVPLTSYEYSQLLNTMGIRPQINVLSS